MSKKRTEFEDLSPDQQKVVRTWNQGMAVLAGAGSGKTTTLVIKCAELLKLNPQARFAAVSFTERSASDLRDKLSRRLSLSGEGSALSGHWVMTIHGLCAAIIRDYPREAGFDGEESMLSEPESQLIWEAAMEGLWSDDLTPELQGALDLLLERESRDSVFALLRRVRDLALHGALASLARSEDPASRALELVARFTLERYDRLKRRRGALDFNDLERGADRALEVPAVREALRRRFDLVLVDEFQDTNALQARIISRFVREDFSNICVVGDPKQSIYRFRDADVTVFDDFCKKLPVRYSLNWNFRSRPGIIDFTNRVCERAFDEGAYEALVPKREADPALEPVVRLPLADPAELGAWILSERARGVPLEDMALLLRKIRGNEKWLKALSAAGIPLAVGSGGLFWEDPRVREMVSFLKWWDNPAQSFAGGVFLRAPWMRLDDAQLDRWIQEDPTWARPFFASSHSVARALRPYRARIARPGELLLALLEGPDVEAELGAQCLGLWHRVEELSSRGLDFHAVVLELGLAVQEGRREREVPPPRNRGQLSVLTLHGAKGLEFPHVILVDLGDKARAAESPLLFWDRKQGAHLAGRDADGERDESPQTLAWKESERAKNLAESKRVFYVALTRARERLILVCPPLKKEPDPEKAYHEDFWRGWIELGGGEIPETSVASVGTAPGSAASPPEVPASGFCDFLKSPALALPRFRRPRHSVTEWNLLSRCPRAYEWTYARPRLVAEGIAQVSLFTGEKVATLNETELTQRELGTRVHACLETGDYDGLHALEREAGSARFKAEPVMSWAMSSDWMAPARPEQGRDVWSELSFELPFGVSGGGEILVGSMDRVVQETIPEQGTRFTVIDFKVTEKAKSVEALLDSYQTQLELYSQALRMLTQAPAARIQALLVNISPQAIQAVPVELTGIDPAELAEQASAIVAGQAGAPKPGKLCRYCEFRPQCNEGTLFSR